jgi:hypothetical protein
MLRDQFERDLAHLEQIVPFLIQDSALGMPYWRRRVTSLSIHQSLLPDGAKRVKRLLGVFDEVERAAKLVKPAG